MTTTNTNPETDIRYGVASLNSLAEWVFDEFFLNGTDLSFLAYMEECRAMHDGEWDQDTEDEYSVAYESDEASYELGTDDGLKLGLSTLGGAYNVWVYQSPFTAKHALCSLCCPHAGDINSEGDDECYTLPEEWFAQKN